MKYIIILLLLLSYSCSNTITTKKHNEDITKLNKRIKKLNNEQYVLKLKFESILNRVIFLETQVINLKKRKTSKVVTSDKNNKVTIKELKDIISREELARIEKMDRADEDEEPVILTNSMLGKKIIENKALENKDSEKKKKVKRKTKKRFKATLKIRYKEALALHREKRYFDSIESFQKLIANYKGVRTSLSDNFYYWIGENYLALNDIPLAREYFNKVLKKFPKSNKVPDSIYKLGLIFEKENKIEEAINLYKRVIKNYPNTEASLLSKERLSKI